MILFIAKIAKKADKPEIVLSTEKRYFSLLTLSFRSLLFLTKDYNKSKYLNSKYETLKTGMQVKLYELKKINKNEAKALEMEIIDNPTRLWDLFNKNILAVKKELSDQALVKKQDDKINREIDEVLSLF